jgi:uncharacterized SAM-binding protein YcdF (DUF218 family)
VRVPAAVDLLLQGTVPRLVLVGGALQEGRPVEVRRSEQWARALGVEAAHLCTLESEAPGTVEEARVVREAAQAHGWTRLVVVTSPYHCLRAARVFEAQLRGSGVHAVVTPTPYDDWSVDHWHTNPRQRRLVVRELVKMALWKTGLRRLVRP